MPQVEGGPKALNELLENVYSECISNGNSQETCSAHAWTVAINAGWQKDDDDNWVRKDNINEPAKGFWKGVL